MNSKEVQRIQNEIFRKVDRKTINQENFCQKVNRGKGQKNEKQKYE